MAKAEQVRPEYEMRLTLSQKEARYLTDVLYKSPLGGIGYDIYEAVRAALIEPHPGRI